MHVEIHVSPKLTATQTTRKYRDIKFSVVEENTTNTIIICVEYGIAASR